MSRSLSSERRRGPGGLAAFLLGLPLAAGILWLGLAGPGRGTIAERYLSHPIEWAEVILFSCALMALWLKLMGLRRERAALGRELLPAWDGKPVSPAEAEPLRSAYQRLPRRLQQTLVGRRVAGVLDFLIRRRSAAGLDDHIRTQADSDAIALESGGTLIRFITWAIPILGFLGTVLGVTDAVAGITPEMLENSLSSVTDGLALAFDTTAVALSLTMVLMLINSIADRLEQGILEDVDRYIDDQLAHRFERFEAGGGDAGMWRLAMEDLVKRQAAIWAETLAQTDQRRHDAETKLHDKLQKTLAAALDRTVEAHARRLAELEKSAAGQAETLRRMQESAQTLVKLQQALQQNLNALAGAGAFEQAVHSLTAAIHLLTSQTISARSRPGAAA